MPEMSGREAVDAEWPWIAFIDTDASTFQKIMWAFRRYAESVGYHAYSGVYQSPSYRSG